MPTINVNGVTLAYEVFGDGPPVVWTGAGWFPRDKLAYLVAGRLSAHYRVLIWDRRNCGASDLAIVDVPSDHDLFADDLHNLLAALDMSPAYLAGACAGATLSLHMAHRHPADVRGLILASAPTDDLELVRPVQEAHHFRLATAAEERGMQAVIAESTEAWVRLVSGRPEDWDGLLNWVAETIAMNPSNRDRLLAMDPQAFAVTMKKWGNWYLSGHGHLFGLPYEYIRATTLPALVAHGFDPLHPRQRAEELCRLLPNGEWVEYSDRYTQEEMEQAGWSWGLALPFMEEFLARLEAR